MSIQPTRHTIFVSINCLCSKSVVKQIRIEFVYHVHVVNLKKHPTRVFLFLNNSPPIRGSRHEVTEGVVLHDKRLISNNLILDTKDPSQPPLIGEGFYYLYYMICVLWFVFTPLDH